MLRASGCRVCGEPVRSWAIRSWAIQSALVVTDAEIRIGVIPIAVTPIVASQAAMGDFQNEAVLNVVQDDARDAAIRFVVIPFAVTRSDRYAVDQRVVDPDALVDSQDEVLPNVGQGVSPVDLLSQAAVQSEVASNAALISVPLPA